MKRAVRGTALAAFAALTVGSCGSMPTASFDPAEVTGDFDWTRYDGTSISVMLNAHPWSEGVAERLSEFQALTGIEVELQTYTEDQYFDKMEQAVRSSAAPDVYMLPMDDSVVTQYAADLIDPLTPYVENPALTSAEYDYQDGRVPGPV